MPEKQHQPDLVIAILIGTVILLLAGLFILMLVTYFNNRKKRFIQEKQLMQSAFNEQLLKSQLETQEYAFNQVSQELHDNIGQILSSSKMLLSIASMQIAVVPDALKTAEEGVAKAITDLRSLSKSLSQEWLQQFNFMENLEAEKNRINSARSIHISILSDYEKLPLEPQSQVMLFRVVQEAVQNSIKHAFPKQIAITIKNMGNDFKLTIEDDGIGFDINAVKKESLGLRNMEHRIQLLGGSIEWKKEKGTLVEIFIPGKR